MSQGVISSGTWLYGGVDVQVTVTLYPVHLLKI